MSDNLQKDLQKVVLCDMCTEEERKPARKTCMKCEISMCVQHLQAHLNTPVLLQTHPLTEPMASGDAGLGGTTKCPQHGKLLEYYCLDDMICVCVSCAIEDRHRLHNMKTFSTAQKDLMEKLDAERKALLVKTDHESMRLVKWERSEREKLDRCSVRLIEAVTNLRDIALTSVQSSVTARMVSIKTCKSSMQAAQKEKDTFRFLQMYSQVHQDVEKAKAADLRKGLEPGSDRDKLVEEIREGGEKIVEQADQFWRSLLTLVDPENQQELISTDSDLIFDPKTLGPGMSLSKDQRMVFYCDCHGQNSAHMFHLQSTQSVPNIKKWVISLSKDCDWTIGLCNRNSTRELRDGDIYGLCCKEGNPLGFLTTEYYDYDHVVMGSGRDDRRSVSLQWINPPGKDVAKVMAQPQKVEVVWSIPNSLSFYSWICQHQRIKIVTIKINPQSYNLAPFVRFEGKKSQQSLNKSSGSLYGYTQQQWHTTTPPKATCPCAGATGTRLTTEVLCELL